MIATTDAWSVGANAGVIIGALLGFYRFAMAGLDKHITQNVNPKLDEALSTQKKLAKKIDKHSKRDTKQFAHINQRLDEIDDPKRPRGGARA